MNQKFGIVIIIVAAVFLATSFHSAAQKSKPREKEEREEREERAAPQKLQQNTAPKTPVPSSQSTEKERRVDDPDDEEDLNRELWEFAKNTPYESILPYVKEAQRASRATQTAEVELPNGWRVKPAGTQVEVGRLPYEMVEFAGKLVVLNTGYYYQEPQEVSIVDPQTAQVIKTIRINSLFPSAAVALDGDLYISGCFDQKVYRVDKNFEIVREYKVGGFVGGLAPVDGQHLAVAYMATQKDGKGGFVGGGLGMLNTSSGQVEHEIKAGYYPYTVRYLSGKLFVTVLGEDKVFVFDRDLKQTNTIHVGKTPQESCTDGRWLYVVNTGSDNISVIDTESEHMILPISVARRGSRFGGSPTSCTVDGKRLFVTLGNTNSVAVMNRISRDQIGLIPTGWYPTKVIANQQNLLILSAKGIRARRPNPKGPPGAGPSRTGEYVLTLLKGTVSIVPRNDLQNNLPGWTATVNRSGPIFNPRLGFSLPIKHVFYIIKENRTYDQVLGDLKRGNGDPKLTIFGRDVSPIHHQLAEEYVTLDNFYCNGEISVLGHSFTTSGYASPFVEWMGNLTYSYRWNSKNNPCAVPKVTCNGGGYPYGMVPAMLSPAYIWDRLDESKVDYRIYGENYFLFTRAYKIFTDLYGAEGELAKKFYAKVIDVAADSDDRGTEFNELASPYTGRADTREHAYELLADATFVGKLSHFLTGDESFATAIKRDDRLRRQFADYLYHYPFSFRSWDLKTSDLDRVREWKKDFETQARLGRFAQFNYLWLPNDHTDGANKKTLDAFQFVAQNDVALGRVIETIARSPIWKQSLILVVEDDAQNGPDHVDATRTIAFVAGPYVKRKALVSDRYDQLSMLRTIELLLGLKPLNLTDSMAVPMWGVFTNKPDFKPFVAVAPSERLADADRERDRKLKITGSNTDW
jgi:YVTN family beta-propeller protein